MSDTGVLVIGAVGLGVLLFMYVESNRGRLPTQEGRSNVTVARDPPRRPGPPTLVPPTKTVVDSPLQPPRVFDAPSNPPVGGVASFTCIQHPGEDGRVHHQETPQEYLRGLFRRGAMGGV